MAVGLLQLCRGVGDSGLADSQSFNLVFQGVIPYMGRSCLSSHSTARAQLRLLSLAKQRATLYFEFLMQCAIYKDDSIQTQQLHKIPEADCSS